MHILFLTDNFPPEVNAPASRTYEHCREWVRAGHEVTVVTGAPNFPKGRVFDGYSNRLWQSEEIDGIRVIRVWTYIAANAGFVRRVLDYQSFMATATPASLFAPKADVVVGTSPQFFTACAAYAVSRLRGIPFVFELRDLWPESIRAVGAMKSSRWLNLLERLELLLYDRAERVVSVTRSFKQNLVDRGVSPDKIQVVTNGVDSDRFRPQERDEELAKQLGVSGKFVAGYIGTHGMAHGLETLLEAAEKLQEEPDARDIRLLFLGDGAQKTELQASARNRGLDNVIFVDSVARDQVPRYWSLVDAAIIHLRRDNLFKTVIPSKLFECMAMGVPVLHGVAGESAEIVEREQCGEVFPSEDASALSATLRRWRANSELRRSYAANGLAAAGRYDRTALAGRMLSILESIGRPQETPLERARAAGSGR